MRSEVLIHHAKISDLQGVRALYAKGVKEGTLEPREPEAIERDVELFVIARAYDQPAYPKGRIVGIVQNILFRREVCDLDYLFVAPSYRGEYIEGFLSMEASDRSLAANVTPFSGDYKQRPWNEQKRPDASEWSGGIVFKQDPNVRHF